VSDWRRIGKVYAEAGEYEKATAALEKAVAVKAEDTGLAELGVMYNLEGKRDKAEEAFRKSIEKDPSDVWNTIFMAGSYVKVKAQ
jgi:tetratricopeptide (TPR) repeat protein